MRPEKMESFLRRPNVAVLSWISSSGEPMSTPIWYRYEDGRFLMHTTYGAVKARAIERDGRVCLCIQDPEPPYRYVTMRGRARLIREPERALRLNEDLAREYFDRLGAAYYIRNVVPTMQGEHLIIEVTPTKTFAMDRSEAMNPIALGVWKLIRRIPGL